MAAAIDCQIVGCRFGDPMAGDCCCQPLTEADVAIMRHAMQAGGDEVDFSEFYIDEED